MRLLVRFAPLVLTGGLALGLACGGDSTGPSAASVTGIAGDSQVAPTGAQLAFPLSFVVLNAMGQPLAGVQVTWTVTPAGAATFNPTTSTSDATGTAATTVTLGTTLGDIVIRANVPGLTPLTFHALAVNPCSFLTSYTLGQTASGTLSTTDCNAGGFYTDFYNLTLPVGQQSLRINMTSASFDAYVELYRLTNEFLGADDDIAQGNTNSQLDIIFTGTSGNYYIAPSSFDAGVTGPYTMTAAPRAATLGGCNLLWVTRGVTITDAIATTDCADTAAGTDYYDWVEIYLATGSVLSVAERSTAFNAKLSLFQVVPPPTFLQLVDSNDDSVAGNNNAFIAHSVVNAGVYVLFIGTAAAGEVGPYTVELSSSTTLSGAPAAERPPGGGTRQLLPVAPVRLPKGWQPLPQERRGH